MSLEQKVVRASAQEIMLAVNVFDQIAGDVLKVAAVDPAVLSALSTTLQGIDALRQRFVLAARALEIVAADSASPAAVRTGVLAALSMDEVRNRYLAILDAAD